MRRYSLLFLVSLISLSLSSRPVSAWGTNGDAGIQKIYQTGGVPQITSSGAIRYDYGPDSFFPLGLYWSDLNRIDEIKQAGYNFLLGLFWNPPRHANAADLDLLNSKNIKVIPILHDYVGPPTAELNGDWTVLDNVLNSFKSNPAILAWMITAEDVWDRSTGQWMNFYNRIKLIDPNHMVMAEASDWRGPICFPYADISNAYVYPVRDNPLAPLTPITTWLDRSVQSGCKKPYFLILQAFGDVNDQWKVMPSPENIRGQAYAAITHGATGIWYFVGFWRTLDTGLWPGTPYWDAVSIVNHEIEDNKQIFLSKTATDEYHIAFIQGPQVRTVIQFPWCAGCGNGSNCRDFNSDAAGCQRNGCDWSEEYQTCSGSYCQTSCTAIKDDSCSQVRGCIWRAGAESVSSSNPLHTILKEVSGDNSRYLLAVNLDAPTLEGQFTFTKSIQKVTSVFDNRTITPAGMVFYDNFGGYGYHLYKIEFAGAPPSPTTGVIQGFKVVMPGNQKIAPASGLTITLDGSANLAVNPYSFTNIAIPANGAHLVTAPGVPGYTTGYTLCYNTTSCHTSTPAPGNSVTIDNNRMISENFGPEDPFHYADLWWHYTPVAIPGDLNGDNKVDADDTRLFLTDFGKNGAPGFILADISRDGRVNIFDYNLLAGNFGKTQ